MRFSDTEDKMREKKATEDKRDKQFLFHEGRIQKISNIIKKINITIIGFLEEEERENSRRTNYLNK